MVKSLEKKEFCVDVVQTASYQRKLVGKHPLSHFHFSFQQPVHLSVCLVVSQLKSQLTNYEVEPGGMHACG